MEEKQISSYKKLIVWQKAVEFVLEIYLVTEKFPLQERFGLVSQMRRAAVSVPSNLAEGSARNTKKDFIQFVHIALGSSAELETQIEIAARLGFITKPAAENLSNRVVEVKKMLAALRSSLAR